MTDFPRSYPDANVAEREFLKAEMRYLAEVQNQLVLQHVSAGNIHRFTHGGAWIHPTLDDTAPSQMEHHVSEIAIRLDDVRTNNLEAWLQSHDRQIQQRLGSFEKSFIEKLEQSTASSGNTVDAADHASRAEAYLAMLRKIEYGVDRNGEVSEPQSLSSPEGAARWREELSKQPESFHQELAAVKRQKHEEALEKDRQRKARFRGGKNAA